MGVAGLVVGDVTELWGLFDGSLDIEVHMKAGRGGTSTFWDKLATGRAELLRSHVEQGGVPGRLITARALIGGKGLNTACVLMRLKRDIFPVANSPELAEKSLQRSRTPRDTSPA